MKKDICYSVAQYFIQSRLTVVFILVALCLGLYALFALPREEEPQISVPMVDIFVQANGLKAVDAAQLVTKPLENIIQSIEGVEHVYSQTLDDQAMVTARFFVGEDEDKAILRIHESIRAHLNEIPYGIPMPLIQSRGVDDVPIMVLSLLPKQGYESHWNDNALYNIADEISHELTKIEDVGESFIIGGHPTQIRVEPNPNALKLYGVTLNQLVDKVADTNRVFAAHYIRDNQAIFPIIAGNTIQTTEQLSNLLITTHNNRPVYLGDVANIILSAKEDEKRAWGWIKTNQELRPSVSIAVAKRKGANAVVVAKQITSHLESLSPALIPNSLEVNITRNYGHTAKDKSDSLLNSLAAATITIVLIISVMVGIREGLTVLLVIPTTLLLTLFCTYLFGFTINRVSLFALIFAIGILVDDAIVITENIQRHWREKQGDRIKLALDAVREIGNPTIMANLTILAALLPMLFVSGMMGPYMNPIPINASSAVILSLLVALIIGPWLMIKLYRNVPLSSQPQKTDWLGNLYTKMALPVIHSKKSASLFVLITCVITLAFMSFFAFKWVSVKMLPFDNKPEMQILVDLPEGSTTEETEKTLLKIFEQIKSVEELESLWVYVGTTSAFNFNGLVRHYYLRDKPHQGELLVRLVDKQKRNRKSHEVALEIRRHIQSLNLNKDIVTSVVEMPPGPPVLSTLLAEIYAKDDVARRDIAESVKQAFDSIPFIVDTDTSYGHPHERIRLTLNQAQIEFFGVQEEVVLDTIHALFNPIKIGYSHRGKGAKPIEITMQLPKGSLTLSETILATPLVSQKGIIELGDVIEIHKEQSSYPIFRRNGRTLEMVTADLAGDFEAPIYGMLAVNHALKDISLEQGPLKILYHGQPSIENTPMLLWEGEWEVTYTTFRDLGIAFAFAMIGIYILLLAQFNSFLLPILVLVPVPLTLIGIIFGHWLFDAHFTATSMIGFIALGGIIIRNALLLIEFIRNERKNTPTLKEALIKAGQIRFRPIFLTAITAMIGACFMIPDPIFEGLGLSLFFGLASSTLLTVLIVPAIYTMMEKQ